MVAGDDGESGSAPPGRRRSRPASPSQEAVRWPRPAQRLDRDAVARPPADGARRPAAPYLVGATSTFEPALLDRLLDPGYRWRTALGICLAALMTAAAVLAFWLGVGLGAQPTIGGIAPGTTAPVGGDGGGSTDGERSLGLLDLSTTSQTGNGLITSSANARATGAGAGAVAGAATSTTTATGQTTSSSFDATGEEQTGGIPTTATTATDGDGAGGGDGSTTLGSTQEPATATAPITPETTTTTAAEPVVPEAPTPIRVEAETGTMLGQAEVSDDRTGYSGTGFVGNIITKGSGVEITVDLPEGGTFPFQARYSAGSVPGKSGLRTLSVQVNGQRATPAELGLTETWDDWDLIVGQLSFDEGLNVITLAWDTGNTGWVNIDYIQIH